MLLPEPATLAPFRQPATHATPAIRVQLATLAIHATRVQLATHVILATLATRALPSPNNWRT